VSKVLTLLLSHQPPRTLERVLDRWRTVAGAKEILLAYGGTAENFSHIVHEAKVFVSDPRLRTRDHQREYQSYTSVLQEASTWLNDRSSIEYIHFVEFDQLPLVAELDERLQRRIDEKSADLLAHHLHRVDDTGHPHYLYHAQKAAFHQWIAEVTVRAEKNAVFSMLGTGSFWRRECFNAVAKLEEPFPIYFEIYLPTLTHHLGFRVASWEDQSAFITNRPSASLNFANAQKAGAWTLHPIKTLPAVASR